MKKVSDVFKSIRFAKGETKDKPHMSTDDEEHYAVGEKEFNQQLKHVKKMAMMEQEDEREYDYEGDMVKSDLRSIMANAQRIIDMVEDNENLPEWCQNKVTLAEDYISTVANYLTAEMNEEVKTVTVKHKTSGKELVVSPEKAKQLKPQGYHPVKEEVEQIDEKNAPTNPELWSRAKALARSKFDVYPSAYANGWAAKWYKSKGGGWKSVSESTELPFEPDKKPVKKATPGKYGVGYSTARHLARMAMKKQAEKYKKPIKEEDDMSKKAQIVKNVMKKKKDEKTDKFQSEPIISQSVTRNY